MNRMFEEFGVSEGEQGRILDAIRSSGGKNVQKISPENAAFLERTYARAQNKLLNVRSTVLRPSFKKVLHLLPLSAMALGTPVATAVGLRYLYNKLKK